VPSVYRQLLLCPSARTWIPPSRTEFVVSLQKGGVLGQAAGDPSAGRFYIGDAFLQLFSFMGCSPSIEFQPRDSAQPGWDEFVFIHLSPVQAQPLWLVDRSMAKPACPHCQRRTRDWAEHYQETTQSLRCPHCQQTETVCEWRWYDAGGCARQFISIVNVYPRESIPTDTLLSQLQDDTGVPWHYFYLNAPLLND